MSTAEIIAWVVGGWCVLGGAVALLIVGCAATISDSRIGE